MEVIRRGLVRRRLAQLTVLLVVMIHAISTTALEKHSTRFDVLLAEAQKNGKTDAGVEYNRQIAIYFEQQVRSAATGCFEPNAAPEKTPFDILIQVDSSGRVREVLMRPETSTASCLKQALLVDDFPQPPAPSYWVNVRMGIQ